MHSCRTLIHTTSIHTYVHTCVSEYTYNKYLQAIALSHSLMFAVYFTSHITKVAPPKTDCELCQPVDMLMTFLKCVRERKQQQQQQADAALRLVNGPQREEKERDSGTVLPAQL